MPGIAGVFIGFVGLEACFKGGIGLAKAVLFKMEH